MTIIRKAAAVILNTSKPDKVVQNVESLRRQKTSFALKIVVVDNSGCEANARILEPLKAYPEVKLVCLSENTGYARGNNIGAQHAEGEIVFIINPDILSPSPDTLEKMADYLNQNPDVAILGPRQKNPDGSFEYTARRFPTLLAQVFRRTSLRKLRPFRGAVHDYEFRDIDPAQTQKVDWLQSSFWAVRNDFWEATGGFDESYFVFMSDVEMCLEAHRRNKKVVYFAETEVLADGIRCSEGGVKDFFRKKIMRVHARDVMQYYRRRVREKLSV